MSSVSIKYKSLFYSLSIHLLLILMALLVYLKEDQKHEVHSLVNLQKLQLCSPASMSVTERVETVTSSAKPQVIQEKKVVKKPVPAEKKVIKKERERRTKHLVEVESVALVKEEIKPLPVEEKKEEPVEESVLTAKAEQVEQEEITESTEVASEEVKTSAIAAVAKPRLSSEAQYMKDHIALINALIKKNLSYPRLAKKRGLQGKTMVSFTLNMEGEVLDIEALGLISSILKKSAIKTVKKASIDFPHPSEVLALRIPIVYKLH